MTLQRLLDDAFLEGVNARKGGKSRSSNPHAEEAFQDDTIPRRDKWYAGWDSGVDDRTVDQNWQDPDGFWVTGLIGLLSI